MTPEFKPAYIKTFEKGILKTRITEAYNILKSCTICPRRCRVNRLFGETGICKTGKLPQVSSFNAHFGEEAPLVGDKGSGTIFFTNCSLLCIFCQNYDISHNNEGIEVSLEEFAGQMIALQNIGCLNINFVTPSHVVPQILAALEIAIPMGLNIPLLYNSGGYDDFKTLALLDGIVDIYMPDFKFWNPETSKATCDAEDYPEIARHALIEMHRQVGNLIIDEDGIARRGLLVRHLVLPDNMAGTAEIMNFIATRISNDTYINVMPQYRPCGRAAEICGLDTALSPGDYETALSDTKAAGINRLDNLNSPFRRLFFG